MTKGQVIKAARVAAGLTQAQLGKLSGCHKANIWEYESDRKDPSVTKWRRICCALGEDPGSMMSKIDTPNFSLQISESVLDAMKAQ